jgi:hypothetical protein
MQIHCDEYFILWSTKRGEWKIDNINMNVKETNIEREAENVKFCFIA